MNVKLLTVVLPSLMGVLVASGVTMYAWFFYRRVRVAVAAPLAAIGCGVTFWLLGNALSLLTVQQSSWWFWSNVRLTGAALLPVGWLLLALNYTRIRTRLRIHEVVGWSAISLVFIVLVWSNQFHHLVHRMHMLETGATVPFMVGIAGPAYRLYVAFAYGMLTVAAWLIGRMLVRPGPSIYRSQAAALMMALLLPWAVVTFDLLQPGLLTGFVAVPLALTASAGIVVLAIARFRLLESVPLARTAVFEAMCEGVVMLDRRGRIVDWNRVAERMIGAREETVIGAPVTTALAHWPAAVINLPLTPAEVEWMVEQDGAVRIYSLRRSLIYERYGEVAGALILAADNTERRQSAVELAEALERERQLRELALTISSALDIDIILQQVVSHSVRLLAADAGSLGMLAANGESFVANYAVNLPPDLLGHSVPRGTGLVWQIVESGNGLLINDYAREVDALPELLRLNIQAAIAAPASVAGNLLGVLTLYRKYPARRFTPRDLDTLEAIAREAGVALQNARLFAAERRRAAEMEALRDTLRDISAELELPRLLETIAERAARLIRAMTGQVALYDDVTQELVVVAAFNLQRETRGDRQAAGAGLFGQVALTRQPMVVENPKAWTAQVAACESDAPDIIAAVPLLAGQQLVGVIGVGRYHDAEPFSTEDVQHLEIFAQQATVAIQNARLYQAALDAARRRTVLYEASQQISASLDLEALYVAIHQATGRLMPCEALTITLFDAERDELEDVYLFDRQGRWPGARYPADQGLMGYAWRQPGSLRIDRLDDALLARTDARCGGDPQTPVCSVLVVQLRQGGRTIGLLSTQSYRCAAFTSDHQSDLELLATSASSAIENARLFGRIQYLAMIDGLTEVYNRRAFFDQALIETERARRYRHALAVILFDADYFKQINDTHGHIVGDQVLQGLATRCRETLRAVDLLGRYGGEEFVVLLPETRLEDAVLAAERLRAQVAATPVTTDIGSLSLTISVGVVGHNAGESLHLEDLLNRADQALLLAKQSGRNRVVAWSDLASQIPLAR